MILIVSQKSDFATTQVINWLIFYKKKFIRLNGDENYRILEITEDKVLVEKGGSIRNLMECDSYWYRRNGIFCTHLGGSLQALSSNKNIPKCFVPPIQAEFETVRNYVYKKLEKRVQKKKAIGSFFTRSVNKLEVIELAKSVGLKVPSSVIVSIKKNLLQIHEGKQMITKAMAESIYEGEKKYFYTSYTSRIATENLQDIPDIFMTSLIQEEIQKKYELRIFYIKGKMYPSVIFSQTQADGLVDCRRAVEFRYLPYRLPGEIRQKIKMLMNKLHLNTGSVDMIVDEDNQYIFLEVNPVGQFVAYGEFCNYYLDRELAKIL